MLQKAKEYAISQHKGTNHYYDTYLPYEFHLRMVVKAAEDFQHLIPSRAEESVFAACWMHDLIEDCRCSYNDVKENSAPDVAEIVRACTNYTRGRNRKERMPDENYEDILRTPNALFVKLCDRIANVQYSKMSGSKMFDMYRKEHADFSGKLKGKLPIHLCLAEMWESLENLFLQ